MAGPFNSPFGGPSLGAIKADVDVADAITKKHAQNTDTSLDFGGANPVTAAQLAGIRDNLPAQLNRKSAEQAVVTTAADSGSSGIQVADDANINFGTGDFTLVWRGSLPDWTPAVHTYFSYRATDASNFLHMQVSTAGVIALRASSTGAVVNWSISPGAVSLSDNSAHDLVCTVDRDGFVTWYIDGVQTGTPVDVSASAAASLSQTGSLWVSGTDAFRYPAQTSFAATYNRALTASEVLDLYVNGVSEGDKWGSQTAILEETTWTGASGATPPTGWGTAGNGVHVFSIVDLSSVVGFDSATLQSAPTGTDGQNSIFFQTVVQPEKWYEITFKYRYSRARAHRQGYLALGGGDNNVLNFENTGLTGDALSAVVVAKSIGIYLSFVIYVDDTLQIDDVVVTQLGATLALEPEGIQPAPGQWLDSSTNKLHGVQPAAGSSLKLGKRDFEFRWTNTWAGTHEAQYIGGLNQNVLPLNAYIESIVGTVSGTIIEDIVIGDGSDVDRFVAATTALAPGTQAFTLANRTHDGTNRKLVVDPDGDFTGSITWTIKGTILEG